ncbi:MAG: hypothetical protein Q8P67_12160 [archaeon]|nr:hypothetical protein [archaeon]
MVLVAPLAFGLVTQRYQGKLAEKKKLETHRSRSRAVAGCVECGIAAPLPSLLWVCGACTEAFTLCDGCLASGRGERHGQESGERHRFFREQVNWEVDVERLKALQREDSLQRALDHAFRMYADRWMLGVVRESGVAWRSYREVRLQALQLARGLLEMAGERSEHGGKEQRFLYTVVAASPAFFVTQYAALLGFLPLVHMHPSVSAPALEECFRKAPPSVVVVSVHLLKHLAPALAPLTAHQLVVVPDSVDLYPMQEDASLSFDASNQINYIVQHSFSFSIIFGPLFSPFLIFFTVLV